MNDDLLARATRALRDTTEPRVDGMDAMLVRLNRRSVLGLPARARTRAAVLALAATFVGVGAWAGATGRLPRWTRVFSSSAPERALPAATPAKPALRAQRPTLAPPPSAPALPLPSASATAAPSVASAEQNVSPTSNRLRLAPSASARAALAAPADVNALYRDAHRLHFGGDFSAAVAAWDRYLAAAGPGARMGLEARYNRAIALFRVGRRSEAIAALRPFAGGEYGGYRREEARQLIGSLEAPSP